MRWILVIFITLLRTPPTTWWSSPYALWLGCYWVRQFTPWVIGNQPLDLPPPYPLSAVSHIYIATSVPYLAGGVMTGWFLPGFLEFADCILVLWCWLVFARSKSRVVKYQWLKEKTFTRHSPWSPTTKANWPDQAHHFSVSSQKWPTRFSLFWPWSPSLSASSW